VLAFDCSAARGSVAVVEEGVTIFAEAFDCPRGRGGALFQVLEKAIKATGHPGRIVVGIGPGSYNGLRTAIAAAEGLALATGAELVGVASVRALPCEAEEYVAVSDARGAVFYYVKIRQREIVGEFELLDAGALISRLATETAPILCAAPVATVPQALAVAPDSALLAALGLPEKPAEQTLEPLYLKPAHITQPKRTGLLPRTK
jgi:tRNA threonylcarbamoyl adenosine modification protein YeaZ